MLINLKLIRNDFIFQGTQTSLRYRDLEHDFVSKLLQLY
jgi:hypothetical protein